MMADSCGFRTFLQCPGERGRAAKLSIGTKLTLPGLSDRQQSGSQFLALSEILSEA